MLFRLLLACMLACASTVAVAERPCAAGADAAIPMAAQAVHAAMAMGAHAPDEPAPSRHHGGVDACVGCIVPATARAPRLATPVPLPASGPIGFVRTGVPRILAPPVPPPPKPNA